MYLEVDEGFSAHTKTLKLCRLLNCDTADAYPPRMWAWASRSAKNGDLTGIEARDLEVAVRFRGKAGALMTALIDSGFIDEGPDGTLEIHDWMDHTGGAIARMDASAEAAKERKRRWTDREAERRRNANGTPTERVPGRSEGVTGMPQDKTSQDQSSLREEKKEDCAESGGPAPAPPPILVFPCSGLPRAWPLAAWQIETWTELYPAADVLSECRKALGWIQANPSKRKTARGMPAFLARWLGKCQDRGGASPLARLPASRSDGNVGVLGDFLAKGAVAG